MNFISKRNVNNYKMKFKIINCRPTHQKGDVLVVSEPYKIKNK